jgi:hypothetical protein
VEPGGNEQALLLPVGMPLGFFSMLRSSPLGREVAEIRLGARRLQLAPNLYEFWSQIARLRTRHGVREWAVAQEVPNADDALADLIAAQLVVELGLSAERDSDALAKHRLLPLGFGLGNTPEARHVFHVADQRGQSLYSMSGFSFGVWSLSDGYMSVQRACEASAALFAVDLRQAMERFSEELAGIILSGAGILDAMDGEQRKAAS